jgi:hypothetical protein
MDAIEFVRKWAASTRNERAASQEHFIDLCHMLGEQPPTELYNARPTWLVDAHRTLDEAVFAAYGHVRRRTICRMRRSSRGCWR